MSALRKKPRGHLHIISMFCRYQIIKCDDVEKLIKKRNADYESMVHISFFINWPWWEKHNEINMFDDILRNI